MKQLAIQKYKNFVKEKLGMDYFIIILGIILFLIGNLFWGWIYYDLSTPKQWFPDESYEAIDIKYGVDQVYRSKNTLVIRGWAALPGEELSALFPDDNLQMQWHNQIIAKDNRTGVYVSLSTQKDERKDIEEYLNTFYNDSFHYDASGFYSSARFDVDLSPYTFYLLYRSNGHNAFVKIGNLTYKNPPERIAK
jgi:hypothetical protein